MGILIEKAIYKKNHKTNCLSKSMLALDKILKLVVPKSYFNNSIEKNKKIEPNNVYKKNKKVALTRLSLEPQIPIIKNIGIKMLSKNMKKDIKSVEAKDKIKNISKHNRETQ